MRIDRCNTPRPETVKESFSPVSSTRRATLDSSSRNSLARRCRLVTNFPSRPDSGEELIVNSIDSVGSSTQMRVKATGETGQAIVSPISGSSKPMRATMSPAVARIHGRAAELVEDFDAGDFHGGMAAVFADHHGFLARPAPSRTKSARWRSGRRIPTTPAW